MKVMKMHLDDLYSRDSAFLQLIGPRVDTMSRSRPMIRFRYKRTYRGDSAAAVAAAISLEPSTTASTPVVPSLDLILKEQDQFVFLDVQPTRCVLNPSLLPVLMSF